MPPLGECVESKFTTTESENWRDLVAVTGIVPTSPLVRPSILETVDPNSSAGQALKYRQMFGVNAAEPVERNVRLFGTTRELGGFLAFRDPAADPWENSADPVSDETAAVDAVPDEVALVKADDPWRSRTTMEETARNSVKWLISAKDIGLKVAGVIAGLFLFPASMYIIPFALIVSLLNKVLSRVIYQRQRLALEKRLPDVSDALGQENHPFRSPGNLSPISILIRQVLQPIDDNKGLSYFEKLFENIVLLGSKLKYLDTTRTEFGQGLYALLQVLAKPPIVAKNFISDVLQNFLNNFINLQAHLLLLRDFPFQVELGKKLRTDLRRAALTALVLAVSKENLDLSDYRQSSQLTSIAVKALRILRQDPVEAERLLPAFSELLGPDHPEILKTSAAIEKLAKKFHADAQLTSIAVKALRILRQDPVEAERLLPAFSELLGPDHPEILKTSAAIEKLAKKFHADDDDDEEP